MGAEDFDNPPCYVMSLNALAVVRYNALCVCAPPVCVCVCVTACHSKGLVALASQLNLVECVADATIEH